MAKLMFAGSNVEWRKNLSYDYLPDAFDTFKRHFFSVKNLDVFIVFCSPNLTLRPTGFTTEQSFCSAIVKFDLPLTISKCY